MTGKIEAGIARFKRAAETVIMDKQKPERTVIRFKVKPPVHIVAE